MASKALSLSGITATSIRDKILEHAGRSAVASPDVIPFNRAAKETLALAVRLASARSARHLGTEHVLLALLDDRTTYVADKLVPDYEQLMSRLMALMDGGG
jgi:ATP-dependent Clp protease ATP-binding subunit ClpA